MDSADSKASGELPVALASAPFDPAVYSAAVLLPIKELGTCQVIHLHARTTFSVVDEIEIALIFICSLVVNVRDMFGWVCSLVVVLRWNIL